MVNAEGLKDIVDYRPHPSGRVVKTYEKDAAVTDDAFPVCKHGGWYECGMQAQQLCALNLTGSEWVAAEVIKCHFDHGSASPNPSPNMTVDCAAKTGIDPQALMNCMFHAQYPAPYGTGLLHESFLLRYEPQFAVTMTPTVFVDGVQPSTWSDGGLLKAICDAYKGPKPKGCSAAAAPHTADDAPTPHQPCEI